MIVQEKFNEYCILKVSKPGAKVMMVSNSAWERIWQVAGDALAFAARFARLSLLVCAAELKQDAFADDRYMQEGKRTGRNVPSVSGPKGVVTHG